MTKRIFRSILAVSMTVLLASLVLIVGVLHGYFQDQTGSELASLADSGISTIAVLLPMAVSPMVWQARLS